MIRDQFGQVEEKEKTDKDMQSRAARGEISFVAEDEPKHTEKHEKRHGYGSADMLPA